MTHSDLEELRKSACRELAKIVAYLKVNNEAKARSAQDELRSIVERMFL